MGTKKAALKKIRTAEYAENGLTAAAASGRTAASARAVAATAASATHGHVRVDDETGVGDVNFHRSSRSEQLLVDNKLESAFDFEDFVGSFWLIQSQ